MKKAILILLSIISLSIGAQAQSVKKSGKKPIPAIDTAEYYVFTKPRAQLLYKMLEAYKSFVVSSADITSRDASKGYLPNIDTLQTILNDQAKAYSIAAKVKAKADSISISKIKTK